MRALTILAALVILPAAVEAKPWYKDWKSLVVVGAAVGSSLAATHEIHDCRLKGRIELCPGGGYGPFPAREAARAEHHRDREQRLRVNREWFRRAGLALLNIKSNGSSEFANTGRDVSRDPRRIRRRERWRMDGRSSASVSFA